MNKGKEIQENGVVKFNYKALQAQAKELGLPTTGKAQAISDAIDAYFEANPIEVKVERRGRPINPNSPRQQRLSQVGKVGRGRPADPNSAWNKKQAAIAAASGAMKPAELVRLAALTSDRVDGKVADKVELSGQVGISHILSQIMDQETSLPKPEWFDKLLPMDQTVREANMALTTFEGDTNNVEI